MKISIRLLALVLLIVVSQTSAAEYVAQQQSGHTANLIKRSLCNTFGGCGAKRSFMPHLSDVNRSGEENATEEPTRGKLISEILEDIIEHLKRDQNYKQNKYFMYVPVLNNDGANYMRRVDTTEGALGPILQRGSTNFRKDGEFTVASMQSN